MYIWTFEKYPLYSIQITNFYISCVFNAIYNWLGIGRRKIAMKFDNCSFKIIWKILVSFDIFLHHAHLKKKNTTEVWCKNGPCSLLHTALQLIEFCLWRCRTYNYIMMGIAVFQKCVASVELRQVEKCFACIISRTVWHIFMKFLSLGAIWYSCMNWLRFFFNWYGSCLKISNVFLFRL